METRIEAPKVIAECGANHMGQTELAVKMIEEAAHCGATIVKFQKRTPKLCVPPEVYAAPHPNPWNSFGDTYGEHRENLEFDRETHGLLKKVCEENGVEYSVSVWDMNALAEMSTLRPKHLKIPSAMNNHSRLIAQSRAHCEVQHISNGMTTAAELYSLEQYAENAGGDVVLYHTTSSYPVPPEDIALRTLRPPYRGFSGHHNGIALDIAAYAYYPGTEYIERHFTLDRTWKGTDQAASLEPQGLRKLVRDLDAAAKALAGKRGDIMDCEKPHAKKLRYRG